MLVSCVVKHFLLRTMFSYTDQEFIRINLTIIHFNFIIIIVYKEI
jgi:hypothetical protein